MSEEREGVMVKRNVFFLVLKKKTSHGFWLVFVLHRPTLWPRCSCLSFIFTLFLRQFCYFFLHFALRYTEVLQIFIILCTIVFGFSFFFCFLFVFFIFFFCWHFDFLLPVSFFFVFVAII